MRYKDISLRKKILLSNVAMVFIPIIFVMLILFFILFAFSIFTNSSSTLIRNVLLNSSNYGPTLLIKNMNDELAEHEGVSDNARLIFQQLEELNIHLYVEKQQELLYVSANSSKEHIQDQFLAISGTAQPYEAPYIVWNQQGIAYSSSITDKQDHLIDIVFVGNEIKLPTHSYESWESTKLIIKISIVIAGGIIISLITILGIFLTYKLSKHILKPIDELNRATKSIGSGDLTSTLSSDTQDEIGALCQNFEIMRRKLLESEELKKRYDKNQKELIAGISHDLNTPLTSIQGYVSGLLDGIADTAEKQQHYLEIIQEQVTRTNRLVERLFLLSKLDLHQEAFHEVVLDMQEYIEEWIHEVTPYWEERDLSIHYEHTDRRYSIRIDPQQFRRVLDNIVQNSHKYRKPGQARLSIRLNITSQSCIIMLQDEGIGIPQDEASRLFESFYRFDPSRSQASGNGLGLAIVKRIIEHSEGDIYAYGAPDNGLCITITLPLEETV